MSVAAITARADVGIVRLCIEDPFPGLWPAVDLGLATAATLLLADSTDPVAVIYVGGPSSSKTTVADFFLGHPLWGPDLSRQGGRASSAVLDPHPSLGR